MLQFVALQIQYHTRLPEAMGEAPSGGFARTAAPSAPDRHRGSSDRYGRSCMQRSAKSQTRAESIEPEAEDGRILEVVQGVLPDGRSFREVDLGIEAVRGRVRKRSPPAHQHLVSNFLLLGAIVAFSPLGLDAKGRII